MTAVTDYRTVSPVLRVTQTASMVRLYVDLARVSKTSVQALALADALRRAARA